MEMAIYFLIVGTANIALCIASLIIIIIGKHKRKKEIASVTRLFPKGMRYIFWCSAALCGFCCSLPILNLNESINYLLLHFSIGITSVISISFYTMVHTMIFLSIFADADYQGLDRIIKKLEKRE